MKNSKKDAVNAYHEAGHAVASWCLGVRVLRATIVPDANRAGHVNFGREKPSTYIAIDRGDRWHPSRFRAEKLVMVILAGEAAQRRYNPRSVRLRRLLDDFDKCLFILLKYSPHKGKLGLKHHYRLLRAWTASLIEQHWHLVEAVAKALLERRELSGTQILDVIRAANQKKRAEDASTRQKESPA